MTISVWIAVNAVTGHVATYAGIAYTRKTLGEVYTRLSGRTLKEDGYRAVRATLTYENQ